MKKDRYQESKAQRVKLTEHVKSQQAQSHCAKKKMRTDDAAYQQMFFFFVFDTKYLNICSYRFIGTAVSMMMAVKLYCREGNAGRVRDEISKLGVLELLVRLVGLETRSSCNGQTSIKMLQYVHME